MQKIALGICIGEKEYADRFHAVIFKNYNQKFRFYRYSELSELSSDDKSQLDGVLLSDLSSADLSAFSENKGYKIFYLKDEEEEADEGEGIVYLEKYTDVNSIVEEILGQIGQEICELKKDGCINSKTRILGIYSLCESELQLPFMLTLAGFLAEKERVLVLDLQENSGFAQFGRPENTPGLEDLLLLAKQKRESASLYAAAIGHMEKADYIYPVRNTECLCEANGEIYATLLENLKNELDYDVILINFGTRFQGFFALLEDCGQIFLMQKSNGLGKWREYALEEELRKKGYGHLIDRFCNVEVPLLVGQVSTFERIVEMWKWNEFGDSIRSLALRSAKVG